MAESLSELLTVVLTKSIVSCHSDFKLKSLKYEKLLLSLLYFFVLNASHGASIDTESKIKTVFIYNFTKYIEWPNSDKIATFKIGVIDNKSVYEELIKISKVKLVSDKSLEIVFLESLDEVDPTFQILFIGNREKTPLDKSFLSIGENPILLVSDSYQDESSMIDFRIVGTRMKFALNKQELERQGLVVASALESLAIKLSSNYSYPRSNSSSQENVIKLAKKTTIEGDKKIEETPNYTEEQYDSILVAMQVELKMERDLSQEKDKEITKLKTSIYELEAAITLKENELSIVKNQIEEQSKRLEAISDSTIQKAEELQQNIEKSKAALGNLKKIKAELKESKAILESQKTINIVTIIVLVIIAILGGIAFKNYKTQKSQAAIISQQKTIAESQRDEIQTQHQQLEEKNREITDSITYAKRIQEAILPPLKLVKSKLENSFILYLPKDIVAGDFYWMETAQNENGEEIVLFAAADCTGHGVPGAMVSVVCSNALNKSVHEFGLITPNEILNKTRELVIQRFEKSEEDVNDGMDIALCAFNSKTKSLEYSGAHNPLWIIRKDSQEIESFRANKQPIGKYIGATVFDNHFVQLNEGDSIYLFSDGYIDQFGGEKGKKLKSNNFKRLLLSIQELSMDEQHQKLKSYFLEWRGAEEQLDDVCVIGLKV